MQYRIVFRAYRSLESTRHEIDGEDDRHAAYKLKMYAASRGRHAGRYWGTIEGLERVEADGKVTTLDLPKLLLEVAKNGGREPPM